MKKIAALMFSALAAVPMKANDGVYYTSGNQLVPLYETNISIQKEVLTISLLDDTYALVDVYYEFYNPDATDKTVLMGFEADPSYNDTYEFFPDGKHPHILDFTVEMNGTQLTYKNAACLESNLEGLKPLDLSKYDICEESFSTVHPKGNDTLYIPFFYVYYFDATFKPGLNKIHHTYRYKESMHVGNTFEISYKLSPALRWANRQIDDFTLIIRADHTAKQYIIDEENFKGGLWTVTEGIGKQRLVEDRNREFSLRNGAFVWHGNNFKPTEELYITSSDVLYSFNDNAPFGAFYDRASSVGLLFGESNLPQDSEMRARIAHNLPYANRGHIFKDPKLKAYFESLWWYMPDPNYHDNQNDFTEYDRQYLSY